MSLSKDTVSKLKNFATINPNIVYGGSGKLKTISEAKNILAETEVEDITSEFSVYDLNELISTLSLIEDGDVQFGNGQLTVTNGTKTDSEPVNIGSPVKLVDVGNSLTTISSKVK